ncbi:MAG TPA: site-specific DNA-methyltransferase [Fimbriimonas sp.]|nr:site-specific DNA-methyltransferase [Fimbriimonas sp.]
MPELVTNLDTITNEVTSLFPVAEYHTSSGALFKGLFEDVISRPEFQQLEGKVQLIFTSPPFPLNNKKKYDNKQGEEYVAWVASFAPLFRRLLTDNGSLVVELGNAWEPGKPVMSTLALEALLRLKKDGEFFLCQQLVVNNPARLPSPAQWVTVNRIRLTESFNHVWWMSPTEFPKADNRKVLKPYSDAMKRLLKTQRYNAGERPSEHVIGKTSFLKDHGGAIRQGVLEIEDSDAAVSTLLQLSNTASSDEYLAYCKANDIELHPARMPIGAPKFFIEFLTDPGDIVLDPFAGSNTTGAAAEMLGRQWVSFEPMSEYINGSRGRFPNIVKE